ncbi:MAG: LacI family DNA-binding transcriptional regulator [Verrucomicrobia bacterium]|nr:LacI family DNA-binding transcriptional regulator [Verrucomicrobiota bacterium]
MRKSHQITRDDVARESGVSGFTVSQALRGQAGVAAKTRSHVEAVAARLGYQINPVASLLVRQRSRSAARRQLVVGQLGGSLRTNPEFIVACKELDLQGHYIAVEEFRSPEEGSRSLWHRGISGLSIAPGGMTWSAEERQRFDWDKFSLVKGSRALPDLPCHLVEQNAFDYMAETLRQVVARGYRRLAVLLLNTGNEEDDDARYGALLNFRERKLPTGVTCVWREAEVKNANFLDGNTLAWLRKQRPDVIVAYHWKMIVPLREAGFRIPEDFPLAAVLSVTDRLPGLPLVSGCDLQIMNMTRESLTILRDLIGWGKRGLSRQSMEHVVEPVWIEGETLGITSPR